MSTIGFTILFGPAVRLFYATTRCDGSKIDSNYIVDVTTTTPNYGGLRYWWECPSCGRRCGCLYYPPGALRFACRLCHDLSYESCNESHKFDDLYASIAAQMGTTSKVVKRLLSKRGY